MTRRSGGDGGGDRTDWKTLIAAVAVILQLIVIFNQYSDNKSAHETEQDERLFRLECALKLGKCGGKS